jgi:mannose-6-phosphate isomerase class I
MPGSESRVDDGSPDGASLRAVLGGDLPYLVKLIDTALPLSVQVHPADGDVAGVSGKEEAWIVLAAAAGATIPCGFADGVSTRQVADATRLVNADPSEARALTALMTEIPARPGTVVLVPARTVHAIGANVLLAEIQQPSDCTYRLFDYGSGRPVHVDEALATLDVNARPAVWKPGEAPRSLRGRHVRLDIVSPESPWADERSTEILVVPVLGRTELRCDDEHAVLEAGELRIVRPGSVSVHTDGLAVIGDLPGPSDDPSRAPSGHPQSEPTSGT